MYMCIYIYCVIYICPSRGSWFHWMGLDDPGTYRLQYLCAYLPVVCAPLDEADHSPHIGI